ncbi:MAG TPA: amidohydrolase [Firmicutes bacterium]|jgi:imidazolonepropionase-like amidohydrolase|nr:amidohydrolase [Bacillota bacterium]
MLVIHNVTVYPIVASPIKDGAVAVNEGKIVAVGSGGIAGLASTSQEVAAAQVAGNVEYIDGAGGVLMPGIIDAHTHLGLHELGIGPEGHDYNESCNPITPDLRAIDGIYAEDVGFQCALQAGITAVCILPGSANVIGGSGVVVHTYGTLIDDMVLNPYAGMKAAFGQNPKNVYSNKGKSPVTRMGNAALLREWLVKATGYAAKKARALEKGEPFEIDVKLEPLLPVIHGEAPLRAHAHRADDIATAIRIAKECRIHIVIEHCTEGHKLAGLLAENKVPAIVGPNLSSLTKVELRERSLNTPKALAEAGVLVCLTTDHPVNPIEHLILAAALAKKAGMAEAQVLAALTINPARVLGIDQHVGSIEVGKDADIVLWSGSPLNVHERVRRVWIGGQSVYTSTM